jgi:endonuclease/exonuclease/phosphatase family metal-dependent hydrolase
VEILLEIRLATFNLENLGIREDEDTPEARLRLPLHVDTLRGTLRRLDADAVALQEVLDPGLLSELLADLGYPYLVIGERASSPLLLAVASRYPLATPKRVAGSADFQLIDDKAGLEIRVRGAFSRPALELTWELPAGPMTLLVVHWKSKIPSFIRSGSAEPVPPWHSFGQVGDGRLVTEIKRLAQAVEIRRIVDQKLAEDPKRLLVVMGDFNDGIDSEGVRIVRGDARACETPALVPMELVPAELSIPPSQRFSHVYQGREEMLDHMLLSQALLPHLVEARLYNERLARAEEGPYPDLYNYGSDHAPLLARFRF